MPLIAVLLELIDRYPRYGFAKYFAVLRREGHAWNHKRVYRIYKSLNLHLRRKGKKRLPSRAPVKLEEQVNTNVCWPLDFMSDALMNGQGFRTFNILDDCSREALALEIDTCLPTARVIRVLDRVAVWRGHPQKLCMDNSPEFISIHLANWAEQHSIELEFTQLEWRVESIHWLLDVHYSEDKTHSQDMNAQKDLNSMRKIARYLAKQYLLLLERHIPLANILDIHCSI